jgi:hypothetical protein
VSFRIAFEVDGVLADADSRLVREAAALSGGEPLAAEREKAATPSAGAETEPSGNDASRDLAALTTGFLAADQRQRLWTRVSATERFWEILDETEPGVVARLAELSGDRRWEVIFLASRPDTAGPTAQIQTQRWLDAKGFRLPSVFVVRGNRGRIAAALGLDLVVDHRPENCLEVVAESQARALLVWRHDRNRLPPETQRLGIGIVESVDEALGILVEIEGMTERPGIVDRVKRLLGLAERETWNVKRP